jgi:hypothetical protein
MLRAKYTAAGVVGAQDTRSMLSLSVVIPFSCSLYMKMVCLPDAWDCFLHCVTPQSDVCRWRNAKSPTPMKLLVLFSICPLCLLLKL